MDEPWDEIAWLRQQLLRALQRNDALTEAYSRLSVQLAALAERLEGVQEALVDRSQRTA